MYLGQTDVIEIDTPVELPKQFRSKNQLSDKELEEFGIIKVSDKEEEKTIKTEKIKETVKSYAPYILGGVALYYILRKK